MGARVQRVDLPGIGMRHDLLTSGGRKISVVSHRSGERDLAIFDQDDPDSSSDSIALTDDEAAALADVLGASLMLGQLAGLGDQTAGVFTEQISLPFDSPYIGRPMGDTKARTRTSVSIVAIVRGSHVVASPTPDVPFEPGDIIVAVGTRKGLDALSSLIALGPQ
ncbi:cation:proton antiporter regulatory subunit [Parafrigoribacterium humi]|uniref:cation:proton antiporter regulatory subunit n=1 Tax=Parafrigoribacterium humi TaxID=3144664 RepID=UPI0032EC1567